LAEERAGNAEMNGFLIMTSGFPADRITPIHEPGVKGFSGKPEPTKGGSVLNGISATEHFDSFQSAANPVI
jgi:hypothetical protein